MSACCVRWMLRAACSGSRGYWTPASRSTVCVERSSVVASSWRWSPFCTSADNTEQTPAPKKKKAAFQGQALASAIARKIPHPMIQVISNSDEDLGTMRRGEAFHLMHELDLKLVLLNDRKDPPVYKLMNGKQAHEEKMKQREKEKAKATVQEKGLSFTSNISAHDFSTKMKQVEGWLEKKNHVRITLRAARGTTVENMDVVLEQMVQQSELMVGFAAKPSVQQEGKRAFCIVRPPSAKELAQIRKSKDAASPSSDRSSSKAAKTETSPVSNTDTTEGSTQQ
ncbi:translation initiation factor IF-3, mitochondrial isoform X2 [Centropristis striata]|uniref:translation initiation factor IF-3, mitochondrial isoform X2 n=1 Tax=Centropristis striata TaxID=184440 RepID=UPI0027DF7720|nr:translation initiation factor IF-3, mitochondrial isoform X2 [Centropristis striata]